MRQDVVLAFIALASWMTTTESVYHGCKVCTCDWTGGMVDCSFRNLRALPDNGSFPANATLLYDRSEDKKGLYAVDDKTTAPLTTTKLKVLTAIISLASRI